MPKISKRTDTINDMEYIIEEGRHYANDVHAGQTIQEFELEFAPECWYPPLDAENDYNKVFGWSYGVLPKRVGDKLKPAHQVNSIRISWRPNAEKEGCIGINIYIYEDGVRRVASTELMLKTGKKYKGNLYYSVAENRVFLDVYSVGIISLDYATKPIKGYQLYPYFGGNNPAPHTLSLTLVKL